MRIPPSLAPSGPFTDVLRDTARRLDVMTDRSIAGTPPTPLEIHVLIAEIDDLRRQILATRQARTP